MPTRRFIRPPRNFTIPPPGLLPRTGDMITGRENHTATLLSNGKVLMAGGLVNGDWVTTAAEVYDPATSAFSAVGGTEATSGVLGLWLADLLSDGTMLGRTLLPGPAGWAAAPDWAPLRSAEIYHPPVAIPAPVLNSLPDSNSQGAVLHAGTRHAATADHPALIGEILEIYGSGLLGGSAIPPQVSIGGRLAEVLWFGNGPDCRLEPDRRASTGRRHARACGSPLWPAEIIFISGEAPNSTIR